MFFVFSNKTFARFYFDRSRNFEHCSEEEQFLSMFRDRELEQIRKWLQKKLRLRKVNGFSVKWCVCVCVCVHVILVQECVLSFEVTFDILIDSFCILKDIWATEKGTLITLLVHIELLTESWIDFSSSFLELILLRSCVVPVSVILFLLKSLQYF